MFNRRSVLICGVGEAASAVALRLFVDGHAVALSQVAAPKLLRRRMSLSDAWFDRYATLECAAARRTDSESEFMTEMQRREIIPLLRRPLSRAAELWRFNVVVASRDDTETIDGRLKDFAELTIGLGDAFSPGVDCHVIIEMDAPDPGAVLRERRIGRLSRNTEECGAIADHVDVIAPQAGMFHAHVSIGAPVDAGQVIGVIGDTVVHAPMSGRVQGSVRKEQSVVQGETIMEIALTNRSRVSGVSKINKLVARGATFAIGMGTQPTTGLLIENVF